MVQLSHRAIAIILAVAITLGLAVAGILVRNALDAAADHARAEEQIKSAQEIIKAREQSIADLKSANTGIKSDAEKQAAAFTAQLATITTAAQAAASYAKAYPQSKDPAPQRVDPLPNAPSAVDRAGGWRITDEQMIASTRCGISLQACTDQHNADLKIADNNTKIISGQSDQLAAKDTQIGALRVEVKGGTRWARFKRTIKPIACAGGGAAAGSLMDKQSSARGGAIGALVGGVACSIF